MLRAFTVIYDELPDVPGWQFFECQADDDEHAEEQCIDANPRANVLWVNEGHGPKSRTVE